MRRKTSVKSVCFSQCLEYRQIYAQFYIAICRRGRGLGLRKSTVTYRHYNAKNCGAGTGTVGRHSVFFCLYQEWASLLCYLLVSYPDSCEKSLHGYETTIMRARIRGGDKLPDLSKIEIVRSPDPEKHCP